jgi:uncharacterized protein YndB with AHSA1/START domain
MTTFVTEGTIARSAGEVWAYATDIQRHPEWMNVTDARVVHGSGTRTGARGRERIQFGPFGWDVEFEVVEADPGRRIVWKAVAGAPFDLEVALDLRAIGPMASKATYRTEFQLHGLWRLLGPMVAMEAKAAPARELQRLKDHVESPPGMAPATS